MPDRFFLIIGCLYVWYHFLMIHLRLMYATAKDYLHFHRAYSQDVGF